MQNTITTPTGTTVVAQPGHECSVSWAAILGGAAAAAALSLVLLSLGSGIGLASFNPWSGDRETIVSFTSKMAIWMVAMQWLSSALGGYLAGRLRSRTPQIGTDEVFFRDTAHGFLAWTVATLFTAALLASATTALVGGGVKAATAVAAAGAAGGAAAASSEAGGDVLSYRVDALLRNPMPAATMSDQGNREITTIFRTGMQQDDFPAADREYVARVVAAQSGITQEEAAARVDATVTQLQAAKTEAKETAEKARKASAMFSMITALSLLIGAFIAAVSAALGGVHRDDPVSYDPIRN
ncbi:MAG TPA: hypothetical protein VEF76_09420 [Patescibacteria group bacterium]|nr:hypothetical protein [Patescibacteria group bacterium]